MKKVLSLLLITIIVFSCLSTASFAVVADTIDYGVYSYIASKICNMESQIDITDYKLTVTQLSYVMQHLKYMEPLAYNIQNSFTYNYVGDKITKITPQYKISKEEFDAQVSVVNAKIEEIVGYMPANLTDTQKALFFNDYIAMNYQYDTTYTNYDIYSMVVEGKGVCEAYVALYVMLLRAVGIEARGVSSTAIKHAWCEIKLNNEWYYVDTTWADPTPNMINRIIREYFLLSTDGLNNAPTSHGTDIDPSFVPTDTKYDTLAWKHYTKPIVFLGDKTYSLVDNRIVEFDIETGVENTIYTINDLWPSGEMYAWSGCFSGLASYGGYLLYNTYNTIYTLDVVSGEKSAVYTFDGTDSIYFVYSTNNKVYFATAPTPNDALTTYQLIMENNLESLEIATKPNRVSYYIGDTFNSTGIKVNAVYTNGDKVDVTDKIVIDDKALTLDDTYIEISYTDGEITKTVKQTIHVYEKPKIVVDNVVVNGYKNEARVNIAFVGSPEIVTAKLKVQYGDKLKLEQVVFNTELLGGSTSTQEILSSPCTLNWFNGGADVSGSFNYATLVFSIPNYTGDTFTEDVTITYETIANLDEELFEYDIVNGSVCVSNHIAGDVNDDGEVNNLDLIRLFRYLSNLPCEVNEYALDINGDTKLNNKDLTRLFQYVSDIEVDIY